MSARPRGARAGRLSAFLALIGAGLVSLVLGALAQPENDRVAILVELDGAVSPATADYLKRGIASAADRGAEIVILQMNTPGGLVTSTRDIINAILAAPIPVATHVAPSGARAASAGTFILYASHVAAMAPGTTVGAATPVSIGGGLPVGPRERERNDDADAGEDDRTGRGGAEAKAINDAVAQIRALAELRGRNADWGERAVREAATLTASGAEEAGAIDFVARTSEDVLRLAHGRSVDLDGTQHVLDTEGLTIVLLAPDWRTKLLAVITDPNIAMLLMVLGFYGILFELYNPGTLVPGTVGAISLLTGMYALSILPFNYAGLALILLGLALILAEIFSPSFGILGIGGTVAIVLGAMLMFDSDVPGLEISWPAIGALALASLVFTLVVAQLALRVHRRRVATGREEMIGSWARVLEWDGSTGHVFVLGERWQAKADVPLLPGEEVEVSAIDGLTLTVAHRSDNGTRKD